jgi:acyl-CoA thioesterase-1
VATSRTGLVVIAALFTLASCASSPGRSVPPPDASTPDSAPAPDTRPVSNTPDAAPPVSSVPDAAIAIDPVVPARDAATATTVDAGPPLTGVVKIMVFGSSNEVRTCWRALLWKKLRDAGVMNFDFVGSMKDGPACPGTDGYDMDDESKSGTIVSGISADEFTSRFKANVPDIVLVHVGGGDLLQNIPPSKVIPAFALMLMQARALNPSVRFFFAQHTPEESGGCKACDMTVKELNAAIPPWTATVSTPASPVGSVDLYTGIDLATDTVDRVHLNVAGSQKVSDRWLAVLLPLFKP